MLTTHFVLTLEIWNVKPTWYTFYITLGITQQNTPVVHLLSDICMWDCDTMANCPIPWASHRNFFTLYMSLHPCHLPYTDKFLIKQLKTWSTVYKRLWIVFRFGSWYSSNGYWGKWRLSLSDRHIYYCHPSVTNGYILYCKSVHTVLEISGHVHHTIGTSDLGRYEASLEAVPLPSKTSNHEVYHL